ncbi:MAG: acetolactate synthase small subunit [Propionibacterium sp.]|nr:MAG: acetolactate synthase small subunit [Propionibacterium sp.]
MSMHTLSVLVANNPGVLTRIAALFSRRGFNIDSLTVGRTEREGISRMTIVADVQTQSDLEQLIKQLHKLVEVLKIIELDQRMVSRELLLVKVKADLENRSQIIDVVELFRGKTVDVSHETMTIEATGVRDKLEALLKMLEPYGIEEIAQSGQVALGRGAKTITDKNKK